MERGHGDNSRVAARRPESRGSLKGIMDASFMGLTAANGDRSQEMRGAYAFAESEMVCVRVNDRYSRTSID